jgi:hypothetical protein
MCVSFVFSCAYAEVFSVSRTINENACKVITCRSPPLIFGNVQNLIIQRENGNLNHPGNTLEILSKFITNHLQYCSTYSEAPPSSDALYFSVYEALISTIQVPVYVAAWLGNWFKSFSLWDMMYLFPTIKLDECGHVERSAGHVECSVKRLVIQTDSQIGLHSVGTKGSL